MNAVLDGILLTLGVCSSSFLLNYYSKSFRLKKKLSPFFRLLYIETFSRFYANICNDYNFIASDCCGIRGKKNIRGERERKREMAMFGVVSFVITLLIACTNLTVPFDVMAIMSLANESLSRCDPLLFHRAFVCV